MILGNKDVLEPLVMHAVINVFSVVVVDRSLLEPLVMHAVMTVFCVAVVDRSLLEPVMSDVFYVELVA